MELPRAQVNEEPGGGLGSVPGEGNVLHQVHQLPTATCQPRPVHPDPALRWPLGQVDHHQVSVDAIFTAPQPGQKVAAGLVVRPPVDREQPPLAGTYPVLIDGGQYPGTF